MGSCLSSDPATNTLSRDKPSTAIQPEDTQADDSADFILKKRRPGCTGMFWRTDPTGRIQLTGGFNWPKDNATLRGVTIVDEDDEKWLHVTKVKQEGGKWEDVPDGAFIPFEHEDHYYLDPVSS